VPGPAIRRVEGLAHELLVVGLRHAIGPERTLLTILIKGAVVLHPDPIGGRPVLTKRQGHIGSAAVFIILSLVSEASYLGFVRLKHRNPGRNTALFEKGVVKE
jgi:hypothetical protein